MVKEGTEGKPKAATEGDDYVDDDGWLSVLTSWVRIVACFLTMMVTTFVWVVIMLALLPWPYERVRQGNIYGHLTGRLVPSRRLATTSAAGHRHLCRRLPSSSALLLILKFQFEMLILGNPVKVEGTDYSDKTAIYISNHASPIDVFLIMWLTPTGTVACSVVQNNLSLIIFPEGTRSSNGKLLPRDLFTRHCKHIFL